MPRFIGNPAPTGATEIAKNATEHTAQAVRITYAQMRKLPATAVLYSLDTTDRGGRGSRAKRWFRWFATAEAILACPDATDNMRKRAS